MTTSRQRLLDIDLAKGLAIFVVVLGHLVSRTPPPENQWFVQLTALIYEFHMPFFMFLSGAVFQVTFAPPDSGLRSIGPYIRSRALRLLPAFFVFALIIWAGKSLGARFLHVDNVQSGGWQDLVNIALRPSESVATSLWYVYVLLQLYLLAALALTFSRGRLLPIVLGAVVLAATFHLTEVTTFLAANLVCEFALFFVFGMVFARNYGTLAVFVKEHSLIFYGIFAFSFVAMLFVPHPTSKLVIGLCSLPALFAFASTFRSEYDRKILLTLGEYTFTIYLMNTLFIGLGKGAMLRVVSWDGLNFLLYLPILLAAGLLGPIVLHRFVLSRMPTLAKLTK